MTLALDSSHDVYFGTRAGIALTSGLDGVAQSLLTRLQLFNGEWFLNVNDGTAWFQRIFSDRPDIRLIEIDLRDRILGTQGVVSLITFDLSYAVASRRLTLSFEVDTIYGPTGLIEVTP
jgi:hypothetical protein